MSYFFFVYSIYLILFLKVNLLHSLFLAFLQHCFSFSKWEFKWVREISQLAPPKSAFPMRYSKVFPPTWSAYTDISFLNLDLFLSVTTCCAPIVNWHPKIPPATFSLRFRCKPLSVINKSQTVFTLYINMLTTALWPTLT
jgi:hypothetical protein